MRKTIDLNDNTCIIVVSHTRGKKTSGNIIGEYFHAYDKDSKNFVGADLTKDVLINMLHKEYGYHKFELVEDK